MIKGSLDLGWLTDSMLAATRFEERNVVVHANGLWQEYNIPQPGYPENSGVVHQSFDTNCPRWAHNIKDMVDWLDYKLVTINKIEPGCFIPPHKDTMYRLKNSVTQEAIGDKVPVRVNIFLQEKKYGHFLDIDNVAVDKYKRGDYVYILPGVVHSVSNVGYEDRYTLQITGFADLELLS